jgi:excisionase family DNA binding protein
MRRDAQNRSKKPPAKNREKAALKIQECADELGASCEQISALIESGELPAIDIGNGSRRHWRIPREALARYKSQKSSLNPGGAK